MRKFLTVFFSSLLIPVAILLVLYYVSDPYRTLKPFSLEYFDSTNRDYLSTELFLLNNPKQNYNSFILGSSSCCGLNTYHWKSHLGSTANPFMFQSWSETITGIYQKLRYLDTNGSSIDNCIIVLDVPNSFSQDQKPTDALSIKDYKFSGQNYLLYELTLFYNFIQKPSQWIKSARNMFIHTSPFISFDTITNDWELNDSLKTNFSVRPLQDSLKSCSEKTRSVFFKEIEGKGDQDLVTYDILIDNNFENILSEIKTIFDKQNTEYRLLVAPMYCFNHPSLNPNDLSCLQRIFGKDKVFDYSGKNSFTTDYNNYSDPNHFGKCLGWDLIEAMY